MIERVTIDGRSGSACFIDSKFRPVVEAQASFYKIVFDDGKQLILDARQVSVGDAGPPDEERDPQGRWIAGGGSESNGQEVTLYRAGGSRNRYGGEKGPTFYATSAEGTKPFEEAGKYPTEVHTLMLSHTFDVKANIEHWRAYNKFLEETGHSAGRGTNGHPYWTVEPDLAKWLDDKGIKFDSIKFDEPTGVVSVAVYHSRLR